jgi:hypothetical protein
MREVLLGGPVVIVLSIGFKLLRFKSGRDDEFLRAIKIRCSTSFGA